MYLFKIFQGMGFSIPFFISFQYFTNHYFIVFITLYDSPTKFSI
jgi:hypothetical protein